MMTARTLLPALGLLALPLSAQTISTPANREAIVAAAAKMAPTNSEATTATPIGLDPINPPASHLRAESESTKETAAAGVSEEQLLPLLIAQIQPTGSLTLGGEPYLLFTERRQKIGDKLTVSLDRVEYEVEIVSIANNRFRIRYNGREAERTIK